MHVGRAFLLVLALAFPAVPAYAQCTAPTGYYAKIDTSSAGALRRTLHARIENHVRMPWSGTWTVLERADEDPRDSRRILDVYRNASYTKVGKGNTNYNREHCWPKSLGFPQSSGTNYPESDCHGLFLSAITYNGARGNKMFRTLSRTAREWTTVGGTSGVYPGRSNWTTGTGVSGGWETWADRRGDVARALFYLDVRYDGSRNKGGAAEPDLILTNDTKRILASQSTTNLAVAYMGLLDVMLEWHRQDPPDAKECHHNDAVYNAQRNRNPFIDHPEWVSRIWGGNIRDARHVWINEIHYDNIGTDQNEMVEIAGPVGLDLNGWRVLAYNGTGGRLYDTLALRGSITATTGCTGTVAFAMPNLQNGPSDALALVDPEGRVIQFLSYEGTVTAVDSLAIGRRSIDVGVSESSSTPIGHSLQLGGSGMIGANFSWNSPAANTGGRANAKQTFVSGCGQVEVYGCGANPNGSILLLKGLPSIGSTFTLGIHNPRGTQSSGTSTLLAVGLHTPPAFPCGVALPGFGMRSPSIPGAFLLHPTVLVASAPRWIGTPVVVALSIPKNTNLVGAYFYLQGALLSPGAKNGITIGLTEALRLRVGL